MVEVREIYVTSYHERLIIIGIHLEVLKQELRIGDAHRVIIKLHRYAIRNRNERSILKIDITINHRL